MGVIKSKMGTIGSKMGRKFEQKRKAKWVKKRQIWSRPSNVSIRNLHAFMIHSFALGLISFSIIYLVVIHIHTSENVGTNKIKNLTI